MAERIGSDDCVAVEQADERRDRLEILVPGGSDHHGERRSFFVSARRFFASSRRSTAALLGFVTLRCRST